MKPLTLEEFIDRCIKIHGYWYCYDEVVYVNNCSVITTNPLFIGTMTFYLIIEKHNTDGVCVHLNYQPLVKRENLEKLRTNNCDFRDLLKLAFYIKTKYKTVVDNDAF